jgi:hypothetical protein
MLSHKESLSQTLPQLADAESDQFEAKFEKLWQRTEKDTPIYRTKVVRNPGFRASVESKRSQGGRAGQLYRLARDGASTRVEENGVIPYCKELLSMYEVSPGAVQEVRGHFAPSYLELLQLAFEECCEGPCKARVAPILEPLKCRLITKGPALPYWASMSAQRDMWKHLQQYPQFNLTGCPVEEYHMRDLLDLEEKQGLKFTDWVSGDYKAATDGLSTEVNSLAFNAYCDSVRASHRERYVWNNVLGCHEISYPPVMTESDTDNQLSSFIQTNGQLMGCPLSFPILCAINLIAYWQALEEYTGRPFALKDLPCLINGDDILFRANKDFYEVWQKWIKIAGFQLSVGKNYISPNYLTVNSESWLYHRTVKGHHFRKIDYLNNGLLLENAPGPVGPSLRMACANLPFVGKLDYLSKNSCSPARAVDRFIHYNTDKVKHFTQNGNYTLYGSPETGGLGVAEPRGANCYYTPFQVKFSKFLFNRNMKRLTGVLPDSDIKFDGMITSLCSGDHTVEWLNGRKVQNGKSSLQPRPLKRAYDVVLRDSFEPMRENERSLPEQKGPKLLNMQQVPPIELDCWSCKRPNRSVLKEFRKKPRFTERTKPKGWNKVIRVVTHYPMLPIGEEVPQAAGACPCSAAPLPYPGHLAEVSSGRKVYDRGSFPGLYRTKRILW